jgi:hypothetical protein
MATPTEANKTAASGTIVLDIGRKRPKQIKQLRKGKGKLVEEVNGCIEELKTNGTISELAQPVIVIVRERRKPGSWMLPGIRGL